MSCPIQRKEAPSVPEANQPIMNIALVGGGTYCEDVLRKTTVEYKTSDVNARFVAVADPDNTTRGMMLAKKQGLITVNDYHALYKPEYSVHLFIILTPEPGVLADILETKPAHIRVHSFQGFEVFWKAITIEEQKLRERNEEIETILNGIQEQICVFTPEKVIIDVNDAFLKQRGSTREEVIGKTCHQVFQNLDEPCHSDKISCPLSEVVRQKRPVGKVMTRTDKNGNSYYYEVNTYPIWEKSGKISKFVDISRDITERMRQEEEMTRRLEKMVDERTRQLEETHAKLLHQDKMSSLGKLAASVVHEINNPISGVLNLIILMKRIMEEGALTDQDMEDFSEYLNLMESETRRTSRIVSNLLAFSRQSKIELKRVNVNDLLEQTLFLSSNLLKINNVRVVKNLDPDLTEVIGSADQLQQVFMNLVSNAAESMEVSKGGKLAIETVQPPQKEIILIRFKDTGTGIFRKNLPKIFDPFFTKKKKGKGVGLGLSVAYGIVQEHGGSINVRSIESKGTTFEVALPIKQATDLKNQNGDLYGKP